MIARRIMNAVHWLGAPQGWKPETDGDCGHLAIRLHGEPRRGSGWVESAWEPTPKELEALNAGGSVILRIIGWQAPVALYVEMPADGPRANKPVETVEVMPRELRVCPRCEEAIGPLTVGFCQNEGCPIRARR